MTKHAPLPPSAAKRWMSCPGSVAAIGDTESTDNVYSREGTFLHEIAARILKEDIDVASALIGQTNGEFTLDKDAADAIQVYVDAVREVALLGTGTILVEMPVKVTEKIYGTLDAAVWGTEEIDVFDFKGGKGVKVEAIGNPQLQIYALGLIKWKGMDPRMLSKIRLHIVQPRYPGEPHRVEELTGQELHEFSMQVHGAQIATQEPNAPLVAGDHCRFCPVAAQCPALKARSMQVAQELFPKLDPSLPVRAPDVSVLNSMPATELAKVLDNLPALESWIEVIREHARARALSGEKLPGHKLVERVGNRKWIDEAQAAAVLSRYGVDPFEPQTIISPAAAERANKVLKPVITKLVVKPVIGVALVHDNDPRPELNPIAGLPLLTPPTK